MGLKEDQESALATCKRLVEGLPAKLIKKESSIANRLEQAKLSPLKKLDAIYKLLGEIGAYVAPSTPCRKGCSSCCHFAVTVSEVEVQYIEAHTKYKRRKQALPAEDFHGQACPFLKNNSCSIYSARPFVCRRHHSLAPSPEWCAPEKSFAGEFPQLKSSELETAFDALRVSSPVWDIRQVFGA
ncbi:YkgJ family cysteine cluster protein [Metapseudomonas otitidis]|uniref:YkgJ family cysteine cluster protein n=1 Tax=Metapseudomonas otitidis TaxID=319939 RepID=UPI0013F5F184|nr:YkgJ family cysteine cluster protein [Pseudomonas otitidis]